jgi:hypothetical protein
MTDTGRERSSTWPFVEEFIRPQLAHVGLELNIVQAAETARLDVFWNGTILLPGYTTQTSKSSPGKLSPFCSGKWKRDVGERWMRAQGIVKARNWIGISKDEARRIRRQHRLWCELFYPLVFEVPMSRPMCVDLIRSEGWQEDIPHSACWTCPNQSDEEWLDLKLNWPADFAQAVNLERDARTKDPHFFLHESCVPLDEVDFFAQRSMLQTSGCTEGCFT